MIFENSDEMALVSETCRESDFTERTVRGGNLPASKLDAQPPYVFANRAIVFLPKNTGEMNRMYVGDFGDRFESNGFRKIIVQKLFDLFEPARKFSFGSGDFTA